MMTLTKSWSDRIINLVSAPAIISVLAISMIGCASMPAPTEQLAVSKAAVTSAARNGGNEYAPLELKSAMEKMDGAERAMAEEDYPLATRLAEQALLDAKLAQTKTDLAKMQKSVDDSEESNRVLREEIERTNQ